MLFSRMNEPSRRSSLGIWTSKSPIKLVPHCHKSSVMALSRLKAKCTSDSENSSSVARFICDPSLFTASLPQNMCFYPSTIKQLAPTFHDQAAEVGSLIPLLSAVPHRHISSSVIFYSSTSTILTTAARSWTCIIISSQPS